MFHRIQYKEKIVLSPEYKALAAYCREKSQITSPTLLDRNKYLLANWLLIKLAAAGTWEEKNLATILILADKVNQRMEKVKSKLDCYLVQDQSETFINKFDKDFLAYLDKKMTKSMPSDSPSALSIQKTGLLTKSILSEKVATLYAKLKTVENSQQKVGQPQNLDRRLGV